MNLSRCLSHAARGIALGVVLSACGPSGPRQNIILISIDTLRADFLGCYGHERNVSPVMDSFAEQGTRFADVSAASPWTLPSHASMLTGQYPSTHGVKDHQFKLTSETLASWFSRAGYQTMAVVNSHNIGAPDYGLMRGFDEDTAHWEFEMDVLSDGTVGKDILNRGERIIKRGIRYMKQRDKARNFFLFLHFYDVHTDFTPDPEWEREFVTPYDGGRVTPTTDQLVKVRGRGVQLEEADIRYLEQMYEAEIRTFDTKLKVLFDYLDASGLAESTVIAISSDHGEEYWEHGGLLHGRTYYEELVRVPLIVRGPGVPVGEVVDHPVHHIDIAPMLFRLANVAPPPGMDGLDITLAWRDPSQMPAARFLFAEADHNNVVDGRDKSDIRRMVRLQDTKLLYDTITGKKELYDLKTDPGETNDLSEQDPERTALLFETLEEFMKRKGSAAEIGPVDEETNELLRKLGYVGEGE